MVRDERSQKAAWGTMAVHLGDAFGSHLPKVKNFQS